MGKIILLDESTINKIAAGEVIERPASIVKELVENSIDASATAITIEITDAGKSFISISDNGTGIQKEDISFVFERHATSKIKDAEDLFDIHTLGFRGEAMASIAAVSEVELQTKAEADDAGTYMLIKGGKVLESKSAGLPTGTTIIVRNLFYNTPARLKFLKSDVSEQGSIVDMVEKIALTHIGISFKLIVDGKAILHTPGNGDLLSVILCIYGKKTTKAMIPLSYVNEIISIEGYIGKPEIARGNSTYMIFSVNKRIIKNKMLNEAVKQAYKTLLMNNKFPFSIIDIQIKSDKIDVNVHPSKQEIKFTDERAIFNTVYLAVKNCLNTSDLFYTANETSNNQPIVSEVNTEAYRQTFIPEAMTQAFKKEDSVSKLPNAIYTLPTEQAQPYQKRNDSYFEQPREEAKHRTPTAETIETGVFPYLRIIGQLFSTYILCQGKDTFYLIDQHAAHERIMYDFLIEKYKVGTITVQELLLPIIMELSPSEKALLNKHMSMFHQLGFEIEWFGDATITIRSIPIIMGTPCSGEFFSDLLDTLDSNKAMESPLEKIIISMACKSAVKAGASLSIEEMEALIEKLSALKMPFTCPHGRPTLITMSQYELEKKFKRII